MVSLGIFATNLTSKIGLLSRKASIRIATNTGKKLVDKSREVERNLNLEEIESVFAETVPKKCIPKFVTTDEEVVKILKRQGLNDEEIAKELDIPYMMAAVVGNMSQKAPIWLPFERMAKLPEVLDMYRNSFIAHELEHALELNNRPINIIKRKLSPIAKFLGELFDKNYISKSAKRGQDFHNYEGVLQMELMPTLNPKTSALNCEPTIDGIEKFLQTENSKGLISNLRRDMRQLYVNAENKGSEQIKRMRFMKNHLNMEQRAYYVTGEVDRYAFLNEGQYSAHTAVAKGYEASLDILKKEKRLYLKNKLTGNLKKPNVYASDKDIYAYATTKEDKQILAELIKGLDGTEKSGLISLLSGYEGNPDAIKCLRDFIAKTTVKGKNNYSEIFSMMKGVDPKILSDRDFISLARLCNTKVKGAKELPTVMSMLSGIKMSDAKKYRVWAGKIKKAAQRENDITKAINEFYDSALIKKSA